MPRKDPFMIDRKKAFRLICSHLAAGSSKKGQAFLLDIPESIKRFICALLPQDIKDRP